MTPDLSAPFDTDTLSDIEGFWAGPREIREGVFAQLRNQDELHFSVERAMEIDGEVVLPAGPGYWSLVRHADIVEASRRADLFCSGHGSNIADLPQEMNDFFGSMINMDDPRHARLRKVVSSGFTPRMLEQINDNVTTRAREIVASIEASGSCDFVTEVAARLPLAIICDMMGIPESEHELVFDQTNIILSGGDSEYVPEGSNPLEAFLMAGAALAELMNRITQERRDVSTNDLTSALVRAEVDGETLNDEELASFFVLLCAAGTETTRNAISHGLKLLTDNPDQRALLVSDFEAHIGGAVEEIVRLASPVVHFRRTVTQDNVELGGHTFSQGDKVVLWYGSGNRDTAVFENPYDFDITRDNSAQLGFGGPGPHFCLGAHLARRQIAAMFRELFERLPDIAAAGEPDYLRSNFINGIKHLDAKFAPVG